jgi:nuclear pore complex protein Nup98-Nup96
VFGGTQTAQAGTGGLFGGGGLFGNTAQTQPQPQPQPQQGPFGAGGGLFGGNQAATGMGGGIFGLNKPAAPSSNLFGNPLGQTTSQQPVAGTATSGFGGLFNKPAAPQLGVAPSTQMGAPTTGSLMGSTAVPLGSINPTASTQGSLNASVSQPLGSNFSIFSLLPPGPRSFDLDPGPKKKVFADLPARTPIPGLDMNYRAPQARIRGFTASHANSSALFSEGKPDSLDVNKPVETRNTAFSDSLFGRASPALGSAPKQSVKKLILDKKIDSEDLFRKAGVSSRVTFSPALGIAAREREATNPTSSRPPDSPTPVGRRFTINATQSVPEAAEKEPPPKPVDPSKLPEGEYWSKPDLHTLKNLGYDALVSFEGLVVGRVGYGEIHFLQPVDLTGVPKLDALLSQVIRFDDKECSVYPDSDEAEKPDVGSGLNVRAKITLLRCWTVDKATREPIKDEKNPAAIKHLKRLKSMKDTTFEGFDMAEGKWTFIVEHF